MASLILEQQQLIHSKGVREQGGFELYEFHFELPAWALLKLLSIKPSYFDFYAANRERLPFFLKKATLFTEGSPALVTQTVSTAGGEEGRTAVILRDMFGLKRFNPSDQQLISRHAYAFFENHYLPLYEIAPSGKIKDHVKIPRQEMKAEYKAEMDEFRFSVERRRWIANEPIPKFTRQEGFLNEKLYFTTPAEAFLELSRLNLTLTDPDLASKAGMGEFLSGFQIIDLKIKERLVELRNNRWHPGTANKPLMGTFIKFSSGVVLKQLFQTVPDLKGLPQEKYCLIAQYDSKLESIQPTSEFLAMKAAIERRFERTIRDPLERQRLGLSMPIIKRKR